MNGTKLDGKIGRIDNTDLKANCWDIVVKKNVNLYNFKIDVQQLGLHFDFNYKHYKANCGDYHRGMEIELLTEEEFNLLKEVLE